MPTSVALAPASLIASFRPGFGGEAVAAGLLAGSAFRRRLTGPYLARGVAIVIVGVAIIVMVRALLPS